MKYKLNGIGTHLIQKQSKELNKFAWGAIPFLLGFYLLIRYAMDNLVHMYISMGIMYIFFFIYSPIRLSINIKKVILCIEFLEDRIIIETKKRKLFLKQIEIQKSIGFSGFGKNHTNGYILKDIEQNKEYWLIETFFNEIEEVEDELNKHLEK